MNRIDGSGEKEIVGSIRTSERVSRDAARPRERAASSAFFAQVSFRTRRREGDVAKVTVRK
jgi:hypothetical protein